MELNEILFGTAYYPEYMPYERTEEDIRMMKAAGMNTVRIAESTWSTLEPSEGIFDFSYIDQVLEITAREGMYVIIGTPTYAIPPWLVNKEPEIMVTTKSGRAKYGHRQLMDVMNPTFRFHAEQIVRELAGHTAGFKNVLGFQIDNETKHYGTCTPYVQKLFVEHLKKNFKTPEAMNRTFGLAYWSNSIQKWDDMPDMQGCVNGSLAGEFERFQREIASEYLAWQAGIIGEYKREDQFITHNLDFEWKKFGAEIAQDGYSYGVQPDINHYAASKCLTIAGTDIYHPTQDELTGVEIAFGGDSVRPLKDDGYFVLECQAQAFKYWTPYPGQLRQQAYSHLASGAKGIMYWNWHSIHNGYETYWKGLLSHDLETNPTYEEACIFGKEWTKLGGDNLLIRKRNRIALVTDNVSLTAFKWFPIDKDLSYNDVVRWVYDSLYELNLECDVVDVNGLDPDNYDMIVTPALYSTDENTIAKLKRFVENGGVLVSTFKSFVCDSNIKVYHDRQPHGLTDCFGMSYNQFTDPGRTQIKGVQVQKFMELLKVDGAESLAEYEHKYWGDYAGITRNKYGVGTAYYIGCYTGKKILKELLLKAATDANIQHITEVDRIVVRSGVNARNNLLHYIFNYSETDTVFISPYEQVSDLLTGNKYQQGDFVQMNEWGVRILEEDI